MIFYRSLQRALVAGLMMAVVSGCSPIYVMRAAFEESKILWRREPIVELLAKPGVSNETRKKLELVLAVRTYAENKLELNVGGSYESLSYVDRENLSYILTAAPKTELKAYTWWFLFIGSVPYKGYFSREDAKDAAAELQAEGYDTSIRSAAAFSTLGWFDDPLLARLLKFDEVTLADTIFHELFHNTLYVKGDGNFNESVANFVGGRAAIDFFRERDGAGSPQHQQAIEQWRQELEFSAFIEQVAQSLTELYARDISTKEKLRLRQEVFTRAQETWRKRTAQGPWDRFQKFYQQPLNNAVMIQYLLYLKNLRLFEALYEHKGCNLVRTIDMIRKAVPMGDEPFETVRRLLADQPQSSACRSPAESSSAPS